MAIRIKTKNFGENEVEVGTFTLREFADWAMDVLQDSYDFKVTRKRKKKVN